MATLSTQLGSNDSTTVRDGDSTFSVALNGTEEFSYGTSADQVDSVYRKDLTIADSSTNQVLTLSDSSLVDTAGNDIDWEEVSFIKIINDDDTQTVTATIDLGATAFAVPIGPGGSFRYYNPANPALAVTASTADTITLATGAGTNVAVKVLLMGRTA